MKLSEELFWRGMAAEHTLADPSELDSRASKKFYLGCDPSAPSLTVGNLAVLMMAKCFARHGYQPTLLIGGATGKIGDPKETAEREQKSDTEVEQNVAAIVSQYHRIVGESGVQVVNNADWFAEIRFLPFLRSIFREFSLTQLLDRKFVQNRIGEGGSGISLAEFCYTTIQGYDFLHLYREHGIDLQLCGADQFGNCASGMHLIKRLEGASADVWSMPLVIDRASGRKFGKSEGNAVWLDAGPTPVFAFYQFWLGQPDSQVEEFLKLYTELSPEEVAATLADPALRAAQRRLAFEVAKIVHGEPAATAVATLSAALFGGEGSVARDADGSTNHAELLALAAEYLPTVPAGEVLDALEASGLSRGEAKRQIEQNAVSLRAEDGDYVKISFGQTIPPATLLKLGKNRFLVAK